MYSEKVQDIHLHVCCTRLDLLLNLSNKILGRLHTRYKVPQSSPRERDKREREEREKKESKGRKSRERRKKEKRGERERERE